MKTSRAWLIRTLLNHRILTFRAWLIRTLLKHRILTLDKLDTNLSPMDQVALEGAIDSATFTYVGKGKYLRKKRRKNPKLIISGMNSVNDFLL